jgi:hypothetical protein
MMEKQEKQIREQKMARDAAKNAASSSSLQEITIIPNTSKVTAVSSEPQQPLSAQSKPSESLEVEARERAK